MLRHRGLTLIEVLIIVAIVLIICAIAIPGLLSSQRASNERGASTSLKTLSTAQADFRMNDRDGNKVHDFWTADVKGLYTLNGPESVDAGPGGKEAPVKLIDRSLAAADADETVIPAGGKNTSLAPITMPAAQASYWFVALLADHSAGPAKAVSYKQDTGGTPAMGKCHHESAFGFASFPDSLSQGKFVYIVNENNTSFRIALTAPARRGTAVPPGLGGVDPVHLKWPEDKILKNPKWDD